ncbi:receptor-type tyrosine-protein phosphatase alpha-like [Antedon mediterranea]|uniref:receptor-type tyrosine-protein phosphatase alpha-like n=1 Tax=Antedon mediterranea TaxID=105859 RepID=UPI003AF8937D
MSVRKLEDKQNDNGFTIKMFEIMLKNESDSERRVVHQYNCTAWPGDVIDTSAHLIEFTHSLRKAKKEFGVGPTLVYSTDCQRTGTVIVVNAILDMAEESSEIDVFNFVKETLSSCPHIRLKENQYAFIYEMILECLFCGATNISLAHFPDRYKEIQIKRSILGRPVIQEEINNIEALLSIQTQNDYTLRAKVSEPLLIGMDIEEDVVYSNTKSTNSYLVPRESTLTDFYNFWEMIYKYKSYTVVMLDAEDERIGSLVPKRKMTKGQFTVEVLSSEKIDCVLKRILKLTKGKEIPREICHLTFLDWPKESQKPSYLGYFKQFCDDVREVQRTNNRDDYVTVCSLDESRSGFFCAVDIIVRKMNANALVDVYHTVKRIKRVSSSLLDTENHYKLCYEIANICADDSCDIYESINL